MQGSGARGGGGFGGTPWFDGVPHGVSWRSPCGYSRLGEVEAKGNLCKFWGRNALEADFRALCANTKF